MNYAQWWLLALSGNGALTQRQREREKERERERESQREHRYQSMCTHQTLCTVQTAIILAAWCGLPVCQNGHKRRPIRTFILKGVCSRFGETPHPAQHTPPHTQLLSLVVAHAVGMHPAPSFEMCALFLDDHETTKTIPRCTFHYIYGQIWNQSCDKHVTEIARHVRLRRTHLPSESGHKLLKGPTASVVSEN